MSKFYFSVSSKWNVWKFTIFFFLFVQIDLLSYIEGHCYWLNVSHRNTEWKVQAQACKRTNCFSFRMCQKLECKLLHKYAYTHFITVYVYFYLCLSVSVYIIVNLIPHVKLFTNEIVQQCFCTLYHTLYVYIELYSCVRKFHNINIYIARRSFKYICI